MNPPPSLPQFSPNISSRPGIYQPSASPSSSRAGSLVYERSPVTEHERLENDRVMSLSKERERTASISPKTAITAPSQITSLGSRSEMDGILQSSEVKVEPGKTRRQDERMSITSLDQATNPPQENIKVENLRVSPPSPGKLKRQASTESPVSLRNSLSAPPETNPKKRPRYEEPPIFAQVAVKRRAPVIGRPPPIIRNASASGPSIPAPNTNGHAANGIKHEVVSKSELTLSPWEPSITGVIPFEELTKSVADFLFKEVVSRADVGDDEGVALEVEAKIGTLIDKHTNQRVQLPVKTECLLSEESGMRYSFQSQMTELQHKHYNDYLNKAIYASRAPPASPDAKKRIPIDYVHTYERDTFYDLPDNAAVYATLPPSIRAQLDVRRSKVRITTDSRTGELLAKIIKMRLADIHVYSPRTAFDWRVSVSLEMKYDGDMQHLESHKVSSASDIARNKDRLSYKHLAYTIDLTQVTPHEVSQHIDFKEATNDLRARVTSFMSSKWKWMLPD
jgi:hypothetical protein